MGGKSHNCFSDWWLEYLKACGVTHSHDDGQVEQKQADSGDSSGQ